MTELELTRSVIGAFKSIKQEAVKRGYIVPLDELKEAIKNTIDNMYDMFNVESIDSIEDCNPVQIIDGNYDCATGTIELMLFFGINPMDYYNIDRTIVITIGIETLEKPSVKDLVKKVVKLKDYLKCFANVTNDVLDDIKTIEDISYAIDIPSFFNTDWISKNTFEAIKKVHSVLLSDLFIGTIDLSSSDYWCYTKDDFEDYDSEKDYDDYVRIELPNGDYVYGDIPTELR